MTTQYITDQQLSVAKRKSRTFTLDDMPTTTKKFVRDSEWTDKETLGLLDVARKMNIQSSLDSKQKCPLTMCEIIETRLESRNIFKTDLQIKRKLKDLRDIYNICRRQHAIYGNDKPQEVQFFNYLESIFGSTTAPNNNNPPPASTSGEFEFVDVGDFAIKTVTPVFLEEEDANEPIAPKDVDLGIMTERETKLLQKFAEIVNENQEMRMSKFMEEQKQFLADEMATRRAWEESVIKNCNYAIINNFAGLLKANQDDLVNKLTEAQQKLYVEEMNKQIRWDVHLLKFHLKKQKEEMDRVLSAVQASNSGVGSGLSGGSIDVPRNEVLVKEERMGFSSVFSESLGFDFS